MTGEFRITSAVIGETYTITFTSTGNCPDDFDQDILIVGPDDPSFALLVLPPPKIARQRVPVQLLLSPHRTRGIQIQWPLLPLVIWVVPSLI